MFICRFFPKVRVGTCYLSRDTLTLGHSRCPVCSFDPMHLLQVIRGHMRSHSFLASNFWWNRERALGWSQYVSLPQTHRLICNMTYLSRHVTSRDLDLMSNSDIDLLRSICIHFDVSRREEHDVPNIMSLAFLVQKLFVKIHFRKKLYFDLPWPL